MNSLDTNVLIYAFDPSDAKKHAVAAALLKKALVAAWPITSQVYGEFFSATVRKRIATREVAREVIQTWSTVMRPIASSSEAHSVALELATTHQVQYWDALIVATCAEHGVTQFYTEDGPGIKKPLGVRCTDPF
jgi:predicted nucleic acid-binding protein